MIYVYDENITIMEITTTNADESIASLFTFDGNLSHFFNSVTSPEPDDEDEDEEEGNDSDGGGDPPLDEDVVHSPVMPQPGGKPKQ